MRLNSINCDKLNFKASQPLKPITDKVIIIENPPEKPEKPLDKPSGSLNIIA